MVKNRTLNEYKIEIRYTKTCHAAKNGRNTRCTLKNYKNFTPKLFYIIIIIIPSNLHFNINFSLV